MLGIKHITRLVSVVNYARENLFSSSKKWAQIVMLLDSERERIYFLLKKKYKLEKCSHFSLSNRHRKHSGDCRVHFLARPLGVFFFSCLSTFGVVPLTFPARAARLTSERGNIKKVVRRWTENQWGRRKPFPILSWGGCDSRWMRRLVRDSGPCWNCTVLEFGLHGHVTYHFHLSQPCSCI